MRIDLPFDLGGDTWYAEVIGKSEGPSLAQARLAKHSIDAVKITPEGPLIVSEDQEDAPGTQYCCLDEAQCLAYIRQNHPGAVLLESRVENPSYGTVAAIYTDMSGERTVVRLKKSLEDIEEYVRNPETSGVDPDGTMAIWEEDGQKSGLPITSYLTDERGKAIGQVYGPFLLVRVSDPDPETGLRSLLDASSELTGIVERKQEPQCAYDPAKWADCDGMTVDDLCAFLQAHYPGNAKACVCGTDKFWIHYAPGTNCVSLDCESLAELPEYNEKTPALEHKPEGGGS